jgi:hypothetical protein
MPLAFKYLLRNPSRFGENVPIIRTIRKLVLSTQMSPRTRPLAFGSRGRTETCKPLLVSKRVGLLVGELVVIFVEVGDVHEQHVNISIRVQRPAIAGVHTNEATLRTCTKHKVLKPRLARRIPIERDAPQKIRVVNHILGMRLRIQTLDLALHNGLSLRNLVDGHLLACENPLGQFLSASGPPCCRRTAQTGLAVPQSTA